MPPGLQALRCRCSARTGRRRADRQTDRRGAARVSAAAEAASRHSRFGVRHPELCPPRGRENGSGCPGKSSALPGGLRHHPRCRQSCSKLEPSRSPLRLTDSLFSLSPSQVRSSAARDPPARTGGNCGSPIPSMSAAPGQSPHPEGQPRCGTGRSGQRDPPAAAGLGVTGTAASYRAAGRSGAAGEAGPGRAEPSRAASRRGGSCGESRARTGAQHGCCSEGI